MMGKISLGLLIILAALIAGVFFFRDTLTQYFLRPTGNGSAQVGLKSNQADSSEARIEVVAENLRIPWEIVFLPDGSLLVTERPGTIVRIFPGSRKAVPVEGVAHVGEGGLLGMVIHPNYAENHWLYVYSTTQGGGALTNRVERYRLDEASNTLNERQVILANISGAANHDGGRIAFGPDQLLYITTGDAQNQDSAQDTTALTGKILRLNDDGSIPDGNPFGNAVYSYGHRNPQGLAWDNFGRLWIAEHGPSGAQTGNDEINLIQAGGNYGWPTIRGTQTGEGMIPPVLESGLGNTWAPADALVVDNLLFFTGLRGEALYTTRINGENLTDLTAHFDGEYGRLRAVVLSPDGEWIYFTTSNTDGRGATRAGDDRIIRVSKSLFFQ